MAICMFSHVFRQWVFMSQSQAIDNHIGDYRKLKTALFTAARETCTLPKSMNLRGVVLSRRDAVHGGGCADIYMGDFNNNVVALKSLRIFNKDEIDLVLQVRNSAASASLYAKHDSCVYRMSTRKLSYGDNLATRILPSFWASTRIPRQSVSLWFPHG